MDIMTVATEYAVEVNRQIADGKHREANDMLMMRAEKLSKDFKLAYADAKSTIAFCMGR